MLKQVLLSLDINETLLRENKEILMFSLNFDRMINHPCHIKQNIERKKFFASKASKKMLGTQCSGFFDKFLMKKRGVKKSGMGKAHM